MAKGKDYKPPTRAELEAMRESKLQGAAVSEAVRREISFLRNIGGAGDDLEWILFNQAWTELGFERVGDWWQQRVLPVLVNVDLRPSVALADRVIAAIAADEAALPPAQRRTQREIASITRTNQTRVSRSRRDASESGADLEKGPKPTTEGAQSTQAAAAGADTPAADGESHGALNADSSAEGPTDFPAAGPAAQDPPAAPVEPPAGSQGDETADEAPASASDAVAEREQQDNSAGVSEPAAPATGRQVPPWLEKVTEVCAAIDILVASEPAVDVGEAIDLDLAGELGAHISRLRNWFKDMQAAFGAKYDQETPA